MSVSEEEISPDRDSCMDQVFLQGPTPPISLQMAIDSPVWHLSTGNDGRPNLIFTITSHFNHPITLRTLGTVLNAHRPYNGIFIRQRFTIRDIDTGQRIYLEGNQPRPARIPSRRLGTSDERDFMTLQPGEPVRVSYGVPGCSYNERFSGGGIGRLTCAPKNPEIGGEVFRRYLEPGHRYRIEVQNALKRRVKEQLPERENFQVGFWWRYGTKEQVMAPPGEILGGSYIGWSEPQIQLRGLPGVELAIEE